MFATYSYGGVTRTLNVAQISSVSCDPAQGDKALIRMANGDFVTLDKECFEKHIMPAIKSYNKYVFHSFQLQHHPYRG